jgi:hypothetical protein
MVNFLTQTTYDQSNPPRSRERRQDHIAGVQFNLRSQDKQFGAAGQWKAYDYPNPRHWARLASVYQPAQSYGSPAATLVPSFVRGGTVSDCGAPTDAPTNLLVSYPAGPARGVVALLQVVFENSLALTPTIATPAGWLRIGSTTAGNAFHYLYLRVLDGTESGVVTVASDVGIHTTAGAFGGVISYWTGVDTVSPYEALSANQGTTNAVSGQSVTTAGVNRLVVNAVSINDNAGGNGTGVPGGGWTSTVANFNGANAGQTFQVDVRFASTAGAVSAETWTAGNASPDWGSFSLALKPAQPALGRNPPHWSNPRWVVASEVQTHQDFQQAVALNLLGTAPAQAPFGQADWPNPALPRLRPGQDGQSPALSLAGQDALFGAPGQAPAFDWPNPMQPVRRTPDVGVGAGLTLFQTLPPALNDWPLPQRAPWPVSLRGWTASVNLELLGQDQFFGAPGQAQARDFPNPVRAATRAGQVEPPPNLAATTLLLVVAKPFTQGDWPNPRLTLRGEATTHQDFQLALAANLAGQDQFFSSAGQGPRYDYPNPRSAVRPAPGFERGVIPPTTAAPFSAVDWPNPRARPRTDLGAVQSVAPGALAAPFNLVDWPNPQRPRLLLEVGSRTAFALLAAQPFAQPDWPNPQRSPAGIHDGSRGMFPGLAAPIAAPFASLNWPNPTAARRIVQEAGPGMSAVLRGFSAQSLFPIVVGAQARGLAVRSQGGPIIVAASPLAGQPAARGAIVIGPVGRTLKPRR